MKLSAVSEYKNKKIVRVIFADDKGISDLKYGITVNNLDNVPVHSLQYFNGDLNEVIFIPGENSILLCGMGDLLKLNREALRNCGASAVTAAMSRKINELAVIIPELNKFPPEQTLQYISEGVTLANYRFDRYKTPDVKSEKTVDKIIFISHVKDAVSIIKATEIISRNTFLCRDMINSTSDEINPISFSEKAADISKKSGLKCAVFDKRYIVRKKMGLLLAVNRGSSIEPRVVRIEYNGDPKNKKVLGIIGKGITFDSGGMNLKPSGSMETMRSDMSGAATVLCVMKSLAELKVRRNVTAVIPLTENMLSNNAYRPGDIFRSYSGKTVEIGNTDAEGRLILADAIAYMEKEIKPELIVDMATLTGACVVTFGETVAAYLSNDDKLAAALESAAAETGEKLWRLPFFEDYEDRMKSEIADLSNMSSEKNAGTIAGAVFLKKFVGKTPWLHIDIAGTAWYSKARGYRPKNATGYGLRLLVNMIQNWNNSGNCPERELNPHDR